MDFVAVLVLLFEGVLVGAREMVVLEDEVVDGEEEVRVVVVDGEEEVRVVVVDGEEEVRVEVLEGYPAILATSPTVLSTEPTP